MSVTPDVHPQRTTTPPPPPPPLPQGFEGYLSSVTAVQREVQRVAESVRVHTEQTSRFMEGQASEVAEATRQLRDPEFIKEVTREVAEQVAEKMSEGVAEGIARGMRDVSQAPAFTQPARPDVSDLSPGDPARRVVEAGETPQDLVAAHGGGVADIAAGEEARARRHAEDQLAQAQRHPIRTLRENTFAALARRASEWEATRGGVHQIDTPSGPRWQDLATGQFVSGEDAASRRPMPGAVNTLQNLLVNVGEQGVRGGVMAALPTGAIATAAKFAIPAAIAQQTLSFAERQRAENLYYQQTLGVSNFEGFGQRAEEFMVGLGGLGTVGRGQRREMFRGATGLGLQGDERREAVDFMHEAAMRWGMSVQESMQLVETATDRGEESLGGLANSLERVTETAQAAGQNAQQARQAFIQNYQALSGVAWGPGVALGAETMATVETALANVIPGIGYEGMFSQENLRMMGARTGMSLPQVQGHLGTPEGLIEFLREQDRRIDESRGAFLSDPQVFQRGLADLLQREGWTQDDLADAVQRGDPALDTFRGAMQREGGIADPEVIRAHARHLGITLETDEDAYRFAVMANLGVGTFAPAAEEAFGRLTPVSLDEEGAEDDLAAFIADMGGDFRPGRRTGRVAAHEAAARSYGEWAREEGATSPVIQQLIEQAEGGEERMFRVQTSDGPRFVTLQEAVREYADQLASGRAVIASGAGQGQSTAGLFGAEVSRDAAASEGEAAAAGMTEDEWEQQQREEREARGETGRVIIAPTPELEWALRIVADHGNVEVETARHQGVPPPQDPWGVP